MRLVRTTLLASALAACSSTPGLRDFSSQVLTPLADQLADARVERVKKAVTTGQTPFAELRALVDPKDAQAGTVPGTLKSDSISAQVAAIEARRGPLRAEILAVLERRVTRTETGFAVCAEGIERRYDYSGSRFVRLEDGPGPCERTKLRTTIDIPP